MLDIDMLIKFAPASVATAFASIVLPVPGGPKSKIPLQGCKTEFDFFELDKLENKINYGYKNNINTCAFTFVSCPLQNNSGL